VAMEAAEHFMSNPRGAGSPPPAPGVPPPPAGSAPPPPPMTGQPARVPPPPPAAASEPAGSPDAVLLIRAMIAAANADGVIDETERNHILKRVQTVDLSPEEHGFIVQELLSPVDLETIAGGVDTPELARQVYTVSLMAIEVDTEKECRYMEALAGRLNLDRSTVEQIHRRLELA
jgi:uncharacterized membrane protein YebE (DUF533 family)